MDRSDDCSDGAKGMQKDSEDCEELNQLDKQLDQTAAPIKPSDTPTADFTTSESCFNKKVAHLIKSKAFTCNNLPPGSQKGALHKDKVAEYLRAWIASQKLGDVGSGVTYYKSSIHKETLLRRTSWRLLPSLLEHPRPEKWAMKNFLKIVIAEGPCGIYDSHGQCLAFRFRLPEASDFVRTLNTSEALLPSQTATEHKRRGDSGDPAQRGIHDQRHYALWTTYHKGGELKYSKEYTSQLPYSQDWVSANGELHQWIDMYIRLVFPEQWVKCNNPCFKKFLGTSPDTGEKMLPLFNGYHGVNINRGMTGNKSKPHRDTKDSHSVMNTVVPFGTGFSGGMLILWELKAIVEVPLGWGVSFLGSIIAHSLTPITDGVRHSVDYFTHEDDFRWLKKKQEEEEAAKRGKGRKRKPELHESRKTSQKKKAKAINEKQAKELRKKKGMSTKKARQVAAGIIPAKKSKAAEPMG